LIDKEALEYHAVILKGEERARKNMKRSIFFLRAWLICLALCASHPSAGRGADKVRTASGGFAASHAPLWIAIDTKAFQKHGLDVEYLLIESGTVGDQALIAGELQFLLSTGALVVNANLQGGDLVTIGGFVNYFPYQLIARPEIKTAEDLKGKRIAITRFGSASDFAVREALKTLRLDAKDVAMMQVGGQSARYTAAIEQIMGKKEGVTPESLKVTDRSVLGEIIKSGFVNALYK